MIEQFNDVRFANTQDDAALCLADLLNAGVAREVIRVVGGGEVDEAQHMAVQHVSWQGNGFIVAVFLRGSE